MCQTDFDANCKLFQQIFHRKAKDTTQQIKEAESFPQALKDIDAAVDSEILEEKLFQIALINRLGLFDTIFSHCLRN